jgi:hypothetical protein
MKVNPKRTSPKAVKKAIAKEAKAQAKATAIAQAVTDVPGEITLADGRKVTVNRTAPETGVVVRTMETTTVQASPVSVPRTITGRKNKPRSNVSMLSTPDKSQAKGDWSFPVGQTRLQTPQGVLSNIHAVIRTDTGAIIGGYRGQKMVAYSAIVEGFDSALTNGGLDFTRSIITTKNGGRMFAEYALVGTAGKHDPFARKLVVQSSYNGTLMNGMQFMAEALRCLNGMIGMAAVFALFQKHSAKFDLSRMTGQVLSVIENGTSATESMIERMGNLAITDGQARNILSNIVAKGAGKGVAPKAGYLVYNNWRNPSTDEKPLGETMLRLYNSATRFTRDIKNLGRFELSRNANLYLTGAFNLATERKHDLDALLAPPVHPLDFDGVTIEV